MIALIIDGNYMLNKVIRLLYHERSLYDPADPNMIPKGAEFIQTELELALFNMCEKMRKLTFWTDCYVVADASGNWRKKKFPEYKSKRKPDETIDWDYCYKAYDNWKEGLLTHPDYKMYWQSGLEGDDWMAHIVTEYNKRGGSTVMATGDGDMKQLLKTSWAEPKWINIQWKDFFSNYSFFVPHDWKEWLNTVSGNFDIFNMDIRTNSTQELLTNIGVNYNYETVYWKEFLFKKLLEGDKSDNVQSVLTKEQNMKNGSIRYVGIGPSTSAKIWNDYVAVYGNDPDLMTEEFNEEVKPFVLNRMKVKDHEYDTKERKLSHTLERNKEIMLLDHRYLPQEQLKTLVESEL